jgi:ATP-dependent helicase/nuclease subunit B
MSRAASDTTSNGHQQRMPMTRVETTTYGAPALERLTAVVADLKHFDPMAPVTILAPNNVAGIVARRHLAKGLGDGLSGIAGIEVSTLARFAEQLSAHTLAPRRPATRPVVAAGWRRALSEDPGVFGDVADHPATVRALTSAHTQLRDLTESALDAMAGTTVITPDLIRLHRQVTGRVRPEWYDTTDLLLAAAGLVTGRAVHTPVVLYLPQALTQAEAAFARALGEASDLVVITALTGAKRADDAVRRSLARLGVEAGPSPSIPTAHRIVTASDSDDEVRCVVREVVGALKTTPAAQVAVLYSAPVPYARLLHEHLTEAGITVNGPGTRPVNERAVARTLLEVLALANHDVPRADLFRALANAPTRDFGGTRIPISRWERTSRSAGVVRGDDWRQRLDRFIEDALKQAAHEEADAGRTWLADRHRKNAEVAEQLQTFACTLRDQLERAATMTTWHDLAPWCLNLFTSLVADGPKLLRLPAEEQAAAATITSLLSSLAVLDALDDRASLERLRDVLDLELSAALPRLGKFGDGVLVAPMSSAVGLDLDIVFLVGLSEDLYPGRLHQDALLPEPARAGVADQLPGCRDGLYTQFRHLLSALASAQRVVASFPRGDLRRSSRRLPSRWLLGSLRELSGDHRLAATDWESADYGDALTMSGSFAGELLQTSNLATEQEWRVRQAAVGLLTDTVVSSADDMIQGRRGDTLSRYDGNLASAEGLPDYALGDNLTSPTALESYATCPHGFFVQRLLGVKPLEQPEDIIAISAMDIGTLIHECMNDLVSEFQEDLPGAGESWTQEQRQRLGEIAEAKAVDFQQRGLTGHPRLWQRERLRIAIDLKTMLDEDDLWRASIGASVRASELSFGMKGEPPVEIDLPNGRVRMRGSADKVDVGENGTIYVTDIKTGSQRTFKHISQEDPMVGGTKLQLPVYAHAARARYGKPTTPVTTSYWFVRKEPGRILIDLTPGVQARYADTLDVIVRSIAAGLFPPKAPAEPDFGWTECNYCNPDDIGHAENRERWVRKRHDPDLRELVTMIDPDALALKDPT